MCANRTATLLSANPPVDDLSDRLIARQEEHVSDATTTAPIEGASERLEVRGGSIQILRGGEGPPLLFLHAAGGAGAWDPFHGLLARRFDVIAPDHPGFGGSDDQHEVEGIHDLVYHYLDRKSTRLNSSHLVISYAVFCLKKKIISSTVCPLNRATQDTLQHVRFRPRA